MFQSHVVEVAGRVAGAAVSSQAGLRFIAIDPRLEEIDGSAWHSLSALRSAVISPPYQAAMRASEGWVAEQMAAL